MICELALTGTVYREMRCTRCNRTALVASTRLTICTAGQDSAACDYEPTGLVLYEMRCKKCRQVVRSKYDNPGLRKHPCKQAVPRRGPCSHVGYELRREVCGTCGGKQVKLKVFACDVHGECTIEKPLTGIKCCKSCADFTASSADGS